MKRDEIAKIKAEDLDKALLKAKKELFKLSSSSMSGEDAAKKKAKIKTIKKDVARIKTRLNQI
jgi:ribosomal protein L29